jgi:hypothetical protein
VKIVSRQNSGSQAFNPGVAFDVNLMGIAGGGRDNCGGMLNFGRQNSDFKSDLVLGRNSSGLSTVSTQGLEVGGGLGV